MKSFGFWKISLKFVPEGPIDKILAFVIKMAWRRIGDMASSEPMLTRFSDAYMRHLGGGGGGVINRCIVHSMFLYDNQGNWVNAHGGQILLALTESNFVESMMGISTGI